MRAVSVLIRRNPNMKKRLLSLITIMALAMTFVMSFAMTDGSAYAASSKKYYLPKEVKITYYGDNDGIRFYTNIKYDKHDNLKSLEYENMEDNTNMVSVDVTTKYKNSKGRISSVTVKDNKTVIKKTYNDKGCVTKVKLPDNTIKFTSNKNGIISKVTLNGKKIYTVKSIKFHKNGFVSKVVYGDGTKNYYNEDGLLTSAVRNGKKFTYKYTVKNGKVTTATIRLNGKKVKKLEFKYSKKSTKDVWKYSCLLCYLGGPSNACELYAKGSLGGIM
jgi:hypothetical protein